MRVVSKMENPDTVNAADYIRQKEDYLYKREEFMQKYLNRTWPKRVICILGILQLLISLAILGVDLPILLMLGPRWQVFAGCWGFIIGFIACVSTLHSTRKLTWLKLKWAVALNILAGIATAILTAFNILYAVNPYICLVSGGCNYLWYTYAACKPYYTGGAILGIAFYLTDFVFVILFIKYGIGGTTLFDNIQKGWAPSIYDPIVPTETALAASRHPTTGPGVSTNGAQPPGMMPRYGPPPPGMMPRYGPPPPGMMPRYGPPPPGMMPRYGPPPPGMMPRYPPPGMRPLYPPPGMVPRYPPPNMPMQGPPGSMMVRDRTASPQNYE